MMTAREVADRFSLTRLRRSWRGRCPACDYPGAFSVREGNGGRALLYCASCQDRAALVEAVARATGREARHGRRNDSEKAVARLRKAEAALRLWSGSEPAAGTLVAIYLAGRGLPAWSASSALRFRRDTPHPEGGRFPAMVALVRDVSGNGGPCTGRIYGATAAARPTWSRRARPLARSGAAPSGCLTTIQPNHW